MDIGSKSSRKCGNDLTRMLTNCNTEQLKSQWRTYRKFYKHCNNCEIAIAMFRSKSPIKSLSASSSSERMSNTCMSYVCHQFVNNIFLQTQKNQLELTIGEQRFFSIFSSRILLTIDKPGEQFSHSSVTTFSAEETFDILSKLRPWSFTNSRRG